MRVDRREQPIARERLGQIFGGSGHGAARAVEQTVLAGKYIVGEAIVLAN